MQEPVKPPTRLTDFKGKPPRVEVTAKSKDEADIAITKAFIERYTDNDGFHCPRCPYTTTKPDEAVYHLAEEINKALDHLGK